MIAAAEAIIRKSSDYLLKFSDLFSLKRTRSILAKATRTMGCAMLIAPPRKTPISIGTQSASNDEDHDQESR